MSIKKEEKSKENPFYPLKFSPIYKSYLWGGRALESIGKKLPKGVVAESWEVACHPKAVSTIANGAFRGKSLQEIIEVYRGEIIGKKLPKEDLGKFTLLIKMLDSNQKKPTQLHPNDQHAKQYEDGAHGKNEMW